MKEDEITKADVLHQQELIVPASDQQLKNLNISNPEEIVQIAKRVSEYVTSAALSVKIEGKPFVMVEGWQFTAGILGLVAMIEEVTNLSTYKETTFEWESYDKFKKQKVKKSHTAPVYKYMAKAIYKNSLTGEIVAQGFAICSNEESTKHLHDEFAVMSHAQTRAIGKAARMSFSFIIKAAGYEPTPAEEMEGVKDESEAKNDAVLPPTVIARMKEFESLDQLLLWAGSKEVEDYHKNLQFRNLVKARQNEILKKMKHEQ